MLGYLSLKITFSSKLTVFLELHSGETFRFSEQIMSEDKYPSKFPRQIELIVYITTIGLFHVILVLEIGSVCSLIRRLTGYSHV